MTPDKIAEALADATRQLAAIKRSWLLLMVAIGGLYVVVGAPIAWFLLRMPA